MPDEPLPPRRSSARKVLPLVALLLLIAVALNRETLLKLTGQAPPPPPPAASAPQPAQRTLASPDATKQVLAKLGLKWTSPGPPVLEFLQPG